MFDLARDWPRGTRLLVCVGGCVVELSLIGTEHGGLDGKQCYWFERLFTPDGRSSAQRYEYRARLYYSLVRNSPEIAAEL